MSLFEFDGTNLTEHSMIHSKRIQIKPNHSKLTGRIVMSGGGRRLERGSTGVRHVSFVTTHKFSWNMNEDFIPTIQERIHHCINWNIVCIYPEMGCRFTQRRWSHHRRNHHWESGGNMKEYCCCSPHIPLTPSLVQLLIRDHKQSI